MLQKTLRPGRQRRRERGRFQTLRANQRVGGRGRMQPLIRTDLCSAHTYKYTYTYAYHALYTYMYKTQTLNTKSLTRSYSLSHKHIHLATGGEIGGRCSANNNKCAHFAQYTHPNVLLTQTEKVHSWLWSMLQSLSYLPSFIFPISPTHREER